MFSNASKVKETGQKSNPKGSTLQRKAAPMLNVTDLQEVRNKESVLLLLIVTTAPSRYDRRKAIRDTWWKKCDGIEVKCRFFTDALGLSKEQERALAKEQETYGDIEFMSLEVTRIFGIRFLYQIMWAKAKFDFAYMLHMDDDYFLCLEKLKSELYHRPRKALVWGSYHCSFKDIIYVDEAWILFTSDVIERFLSQDPQRVVCHPHSDQQIGFWLSSLYGNKTTLIEFDDHRLHHYPPAREMENFKNFPRVCDKYLGVHGSSPEMIRNFWRNSGDARELLVRSPKLTRITETCHFTNVFNISLMGGMYKFELRPCIKNPRWTPGEGMWQGTHGR
ncbi:hypothetical protein ACROYT_G043084 [Oculina patagonica]